MAFGAAIFFTVALLVVTAYFLMGSVPLLILKHDTPMDSKFVRGFLDTYYLAATYVAGATAVTYGLSGRPGFAAGAAAIALSNHLLRRTVIPRLEALQGEIATAPGQAIRAFRAVHVVAILANLVQLALIVGGLIALSMQSR